MPGTECVRARIVGSARPAYSACHAMQWRCWSGTRASGCRRDPQLHARLSHFVCLCLTATRISPSLRDNSAGANVALADDPDFFQAPPCGHLSSARPCCGLQADSSSDWNKEQRLTVAQWHNTMKHLRNTAKMGRSQRQTINDVGLRGTEVVAYVSDGRVGVETLRPKRSVLVIKQCGL